LCGGISGGVAGKNQGRLFYLRDIVVLLHACNQELNRQTHPVAWSVEIFLSREIGSLAVPMFFVISGFLLGWYFLPPMGAWYRRLLKRRFFSLCVPYLLWCAIAAVTLLPFTILGNHLSGRELVHNTCLADASWSVTNLLRIFGGDLFGFPVNGPLWYVRNLLLLLLISPVLLWSMKRRLVGVVLCGMLGIAFCLHDCIPRSYWQFFESGFSLRGLFFYYLGMLCAVHDWKFTVSVWAQYAVIGGWLVLAGVGTWMLAGGERVLFFSIVQKVVNLAGVAGMWMLYDRIPGAGRIAAWPVSGSAFFLYACHCIILGTLFCNRSTQGMQRILGPSSELLVYAAKVAVTLTVVLLAAELLRRFLPRFYSLLTGGRG
jgi:peptidoglycan/LPS O-acetylase OafA/YrhL